MNEIQKLLVMVEDKRFYKHHGIDLKAILRAFLVNIRQRRYAQGASTITQQLARMLYLNNKKTLIRKIIEIGIAFYLEAKYSKQEILDLYCKQCHLGLGIKGFRQAARHYFNKTLFETTLKEKATLIAMLRGYNSKLLNTRIEKILFQYRNYK